MTPEILSTLARTRQHLFTVTFRTAAPGAIAGALLAPAALEAVVTMDRLAETGDVIATQQACQGWVRACKTALKQFCVHVWVTDGTGTYCLRCTRPQDTAPAAAAVSAGTPGARKNARRSHR